MHELKPGTIILRFPNEQFSIYRSNDYVEFSIALPSEFGTLIKNYYTKTIHILEFELTKQLLAYFKYLFDLSRSNSNEKLLNSAFEMFKFIIGICSDKKHEKYLPDNNFSEQSCDLLKKSINSTSPGIYTAQKMGIGYESFRKKFKQIMNLSPKQYIMQLKFEKAANMILNDYSIKETAFELGYSEIPAFSRQFKKYHNNSPSEYRQKNRHLYDS